MRITDCVWHIAIVELLEGKKRIKIASRMHLVPIFIHFVSFLLIFIGFKVILEKIG